MRRIAVLGGGASGVLLALHLLRGRQDDPEVVMVERRPELGAGIAYATHHPDHLLNVRAANMSAFPDDPGHFAAWLAERKDAPCGAEGFAPRHLYAAYLADLVAPLLASGRLRAVRGEAVSLSLAAEDVAVSCRDAAGRPLPLLHAAAAVLATGNEGPPLPPEPWRHTGWGDPGPCRVPAEAPVVVVGTGLTMVDRVLWLLHGGHRGSITAVSRHGLLPQAHRAGLPAIPLATEDVPFGAPLIDIARWLRARAAAAERDGGDWRQAVDALRPHTQALWRHLPHEERRRFLRHLRPFWDVHRHRIAPQASQRLAEAAACGRFRVVAGHVTDFTPQPPGVTVSVARRGGTGTERIDAAAVFECRGRAPDVGRTDNPLLRSLLGDGLARPDPLGLGLAVAEDGALLAADGRPSDRLFAIGPITSGVFWEVVAIPDIRQHARDLATRLLRGIDQAD